MDDKTLVSLSRRLSRHLRHEPGAIGIELGPGGWTGVDALPAALACHGRGLSRAELAEVLARNDKQRFAFDEAGRRIRANQGHNVAVDLGLAVVPPPEILYHGTVARFLPSIRSAGPMPMNRHAVHLSATVHTKIRVGSGRGKPVVLEVAAGEMARSGHEFRRRANGVRLAGRVPPEFLHEAD
jgi:putative RNA 2'-phosphotransferase